MGWGGEMRQRKTSSPVMATYAGQPDLPSSNDLTYKPYHSDRLCPIFDHLHFGKIGQLFWNPQQRWLNIDYHEYKSYFCVFFQADIENDMSLRK